MAGYDLVVPPIATTMFRDEDGMIDPVWNEYFNKLVGQPEFLNVTQVLVDQILVGYEIYSTDYVAGTTGWRIASDAGVGVAEFNIPIVSYADVTGTKPPSDADNTSTIVLGGLITTGSITFTQGGTVTAGVTGDTSGDTATRFWAGSTYANRDSAPFRVRQDGSVVATSIAIGTGSSYVGNTISTSYTAADETETVISNGIVTTGTIQVVQGGTVAAGMTGNTSGDTATRFWAGSSFANRSTAPFRVRQDGVAYMTAGVIGGSVALTASSTSLIVTGGSGLGNKISFGTTSDGSISGQSGSVGLVSTGSGWLYFNTASTSMRYEGAILFPINNNAVSLGKSSNNFNTIYCSTINVPTGNITTANITTTATNLVSGTSLQLAGSSSVTLINGSYSAVLTTGVFRPSSNNLLNLGYINYRWNRLYTSGVTVGTTNVHDVLDDLQALHDIKQTKDGKMDILTMPERVVDYKSAREHLKISEKNNFSDAEIDKELKDHSKQAHLLGVDLPSFVNLVEGAVRQLDKETSAFLYDLLDTVGDLKAEVKKLKETK
jgi:predicted regulator of Ras-like GTPase activity (Roadblock/LC7/MglB family)